MRAQAGRAYRPALLVATFACCAVLALRVFTAQDEALLTVTHHARALRPGEAVLLSVSARRPIASMRADAFGQAVEFYRDGSPGEWHAVIGIDVDAVPGPARFVVTAKTEDGATLSAPYSLSVVSRQFPARKLTVDPKFVTPPASERPRIEREQKKLAALLSTVTPRRIWAGGFQPPVDAPASSSFGVRSIYNEKLFSTHRGADFSAPAGAPARAPNAGQVVLAEELYYSGNTVVLDHGLGVHSLLAHLSRIGVHPGEEVARGAVVGAVGATGRATGPHLHWTLRIGSAAVDPLSMLFVTAEAGAR